MRIIDLSGKSVGNVPLGDADSAGVGPHHIWVSTSDGLIKFYGTTGKLLATQSMDYNHDSTSAPVFSPDGKSWYWSKTSTSDRDPNQQWTSTIYRGAVGSANQALGNVTLSGGNRMTPIKVVRGQIYMAPETIVGGGGRGVGVGVWTMDTSGNLRKVDSTCRLADVSMVDGSLLCLETSGLPLTFRTPNGHVTKLAVPTASSYDCAGISLSYDAKQFFVDGLNANGICGGVPSILGPTTGGKSTVLSGAGEISGTFLPDGRILTRTVRENGVPSFSIRSRDGTTSALVTPADSSDISALLVIPWPESS